MISSELANLSFRSDGASVYLASHPRPVVELPDEDAAHRAVAMLDAFEFYEDGARFTAASEHVVFRSTSVADLFEDVYGHVARRAALPPTPALIRRPTTTSVQLEQLADHN